MDPFVTQIEAICCEHVTRAKWVFVPSHAVGRTLGERIALTGTNWLNLRFVTPLDVALRMGAPFLVERGIDPSEEGLGPALIMRLMLDLPKDGGYFRPLADQPTLAQALWSTVRELRMAGIRSDDLKPEAFASAAKYTELRALLASYERFLDLNRRGDMALVYQEALKHPDWCPIQPQDCWTALPGVVWAPLQRRLMDAMPGERVVPKALALPGTRVPRRLSSAVVERVVPEAGYSPLAFLLSPETEQGHPIPAFRTPNAEPRTPSAERRIPNVERRTPSLERRVFLFHAGGREAEVEEVFRRILAAGALLDQVSDYHVNIFYSEEDSGYIADIPDLEACSAFGLSPEQALAEVGKASFSEPRESAPSSI